MPRLPDFHAPAGSYFSWQLVLELASFARNRVGGSLGGTTDKLAKDSGDKKRLKKSVKAAKNRPTFELSRKLRILTDTKTNNTPNFDGHTTSHIRSVRLAPIK